MIETEEFGDAGVSVPSSLSCSTFKPFAISASASFCLIFQYFADVLVAVTSDVNYSDVTCGTYGIKRLKNMFV